MADSRAVRPVLATVIAVWEGVAFVLAILQLAMIYLFRTHIALPMPSKVQTFCIIAGALLALFGGLNLWQMKPLAWKLLATRLLVDIIALADVMRHPPVLPAMNGMNTTTISVATTGSHVIAILWLAVNAVIVWYSYNVTKKPAVVTV